VGYKICHYQGLWKQVRARIKIFFFGLPWRTDWIKIFTLNLKDWMSVSGRLGLGRKRTFAQSTGNVITGRDNNLYNIFRDAPPSENPDSGNLYRVYPSCHHWSLQNVIYFLLVNVKQVLFQLHFLQSVWVRAWICTNIN
jgi:hypothetical protein